MFACWCGKSVLIDCTQVLSGREIRKANFTVVLAADGLPLHVSFSDGGILENCSVSSRLEHYKQEQLEFEQIVKERVYSTGR